MRIGTRVAVGIVALGVAVGVAAPAHADEGSVISVTTTKAAWQYPSSGCGTVTAVVEVQGQDASATSGVAADETWTADLALTNPYGDPSWSATKVLSGTGPATAQQATLPVCWWTGGIGYFDVAATVHTSTGQTEVVHTEVVIGLKSTLTLDAGPEPVKKGKKLMAKGKLATNQGAFLDGFMKGERVHLQRHLPGTHTWHEVAAMKVDTHGRYAFTVSATKTYDWRVVYRGVGDVVTAKTSAVDRVKVKH